MRRSELLLPLSFFFFCCSSRPSINRIAEIGTSHIDSFLARFPAAVLYFPGNGQNDVRERTFVKELNWAAQRLQELDYGPAVAKVNCGESQCGYCKGDTGTGCLLAFRDGHKVSPSPRGLPDRNAIIAAVLQLTLWGNVQIIESSAEWYHLQRECQNSSSSCNILLLYVKEMGSHEHRVFLELIYGIKSYNKEFNRKKGGELWIYAITTRKEVTVGLVLPPSWDEEGSETLLWVFRCSRENEQTLCTNCKARDSFREKQKFRQSLEVPEPMMETCPKDLLEKNSNGVFRKKSCRSFLHRGALEVLQLAAFVEAFHRPPWNQAVEVEGLITSGFEDLGLPVAYILHEQMHAMEAEECARTLATWSRGSLAVAIASFQDISTVQWNLWELTPNISGVLIKGLEEGDGSVLMSGLDTKHDIIRECLEGTRRVKVSKERTSRESIPEEFIPQLIQDDPVTLALRKLQPLDRNLLLSLNDTSVESYLSSSRVGFIFFSLPWETDSLLAEIYLEWAFKNTGLEGAKVDCFNWTDVCQKYGIYEFPSLLVFLNGSSAGPYSGLWHGADLASFIVRASKHKVPTALSTLEEVVFFMEGYNNESHRATSYLAILNSNDTNSVLAFEKVSKLFLGRNLFAMVFDNIAPQLAKELGHSLPLVVALRPDDIFQTRSFLDQQELSFSSENLLSFVDRELLHVFPKLNVHSFSDLRRKGRPLAIFIRDESHRSTKVFSFLGSMVAQRKEQLLQTFCWLESNKTEAKLMTTLYGLPSAPSLLIIDEKQVFIYDNEFCEGNILQWTENVAKRKLEPSYTLENKQWLPLQPDFDFLHKIREDEKSADQKNNPHWLEEYFL